MDINISNYLRLDVQDMIMVLISTFLIVFICKKFFWNYLKEYLAKREAFIQSQLDESADKLKESKALKEQYEAKIANAKSEANEIVNNATMNAKAEATQIVEDAKKSAIAIKEKAAQDIEHEKQKAKADIKQQISDVAFMVAEKIVDKELDADAHQKYVDEFISEAGDNSWQA